jgi:hypothetical protein
VWSAAHRNLAAVFAKISPAVRSGLVAANTKPSGPASKTAITVATSEPTVSMTATSSST